MRPASFRYRAFYLYAIIYDFHNTGVYFSENSTVTSPKTGIATFGENFRPLFAIVYGWWTALVKLKFAFFKIVCNYFLLFFFLWVFILISCLSFWKFILRLRNYKSFLTAIVKTILKLLLIYLFQRLLIIAYILSCIYTHINLTLLKIHFVLNKISF